MDSPLLARFTAQCTEEQVAQRAVYRGLGFSAEEVTRLMEPLETLHRRCIRSFHCFYANSETRYRVRAGEIFDWAVVREDHDLTDWVETAVVAECTSESEARAIAERRARRAD